MFERFGLMKSVDEVNAAAEGFLKEGDTEALVAMAEENGIDKEDAQDYIDGLLDEFTTQMMAAMGRLDVIKRESIAQVKDAHHRANQTMIHIMVKGMVSEPSVAAGVLAEENIITSIVGIMCDNGICTGTDEDLKRIIRTYVTAPADKDAIKKTLQEIKAQYE